MDGSWRETRIMVFSRATSMAMAMLHRVFGSNSRRRQSNYLSVDSTSGTSSKGRKVVEPWVLAKINMAEADMVLPKLPVPPLAQTMERYLAAIQAIVSPSQFQATAAIVEQFMANGGIGQRIQKELTSKREKEDNWAYQWWLEDMYMNIKLPVAINSSPGWTFPKQNFNTQSDMLNYVSRFIRGMVDYKDILDRKAWPVDRATSREKGQPLCMEQYYRFFTSYRVPGIEKDHLRSTWTDVPPEEQHIIVAKDNEFFKVVVKRYGKWLREGAIMAQLESILAAPATAGTDPVGILTSQRREVWAAVRQLMLSDARNAESMEEIETSLFIVCFDKPLPTSFNWVGSGAVLDDARDEVNVAHQMLNGGGMAYNSGNRWFDKTAQFIFTTDGTIGLCFEHSALEGIAIVQMMDRLLVKLESDSAELKRIEDPSLVPRRLGWNVSDKVKSAIKVAMEDIDGVVGDVDMMIHRYRGYGKNFPKKCKCSPDAFIQIALQVAYYRLHGKLVATYESASTRRFRRGRVDNIRAATMDALRLAQAMLPDSGVSDADKKKFFDQAIKTQTEIMVQNILGEGIDIHLLGLREMSKEMGYHDLDLFEDPSYKTANHFGLSTSQVPTSTDSYVYYAAVVPDGYGASYNPHEDEIVFCISSFKSCPTTSTVEFQKSLDFALDGFKDLFQKFYDLKEK